MISWSVVHIISYECTQNCATLALFDQNSMPLKLNSIRFLIHIWNFISSIPWFRIFASIWPCYTKPQNLDKRPGPNDVRVRKCFWHWDILSINLLIQWFSREKGYSPRELNIKTNLSSYPHIRIYEFIRTITNFKHSTISSELYIKKLLRSISL